MKQIRLFTIIFITAETVWAPRIPSQRMFFIVGSSSVTIISSGLQKKSQDHPKPPSITDLTRKMEIADNFKALRKIHNPQITFRYHELCKKIQIQGNELLKSLEIDLEISKHKNDEKLCTQISNQIKKLKQALLFFEQAHRQ